MSENTNRISIIGGGISGLVSAIFAQIKGYNSIIYEKNNEVGGLVCKANLKKAEYNESFLYFYKSDELKCLYEKIGLDEIEENENEFYLQYKGFKLYRDLKKLEEELIRISFLDTKRIKAFIKLVEEAKDMCLFYEKPSDCFTLLEPLKYSKIMKVNSKIYNKYHSISLEKYFKDFESKEIKSLFELVLPKKSSMYSLLFILGMYASNKLVRIKMNSNEMINRLKNKYLSLGGSIECNKTLESVNIEKGKIIGLNFIDNTFVHSDKVIFAMDIKYVYDVILKKKFKDKKLEYKFEDYKSYPINSLLSFDFALKDKLEEVPYIFASDISRVKIASSNIDKLSFINRGNNLITCNILQSNEDYVYWKLMSKNGALYKKEINKIFDIVEENLKRILKNDFGININIKQSEYIGPIEFENKYNSYRGCLFGFALDSSAKIIEHNPRIESLSNAYFATQWMSIPGGIMNAIINGYYSILRIEYDDNKKRDIT